MRIRDTSILTQTDDEGYFRIQPAPVGTFYLIVDGSTVTRSGSWPDLELEVTTIPGREKTLPMPVYLLPIDLPNGIFVSETHGGTVTLPGIPGFALEIQPGSVTFPNGSKSGVVSATMVHSDRVPMTPNFGQQPRLIVTIQPAGARFDPPARLTLPNVEGLAPGEVTDLYSFDHDLGHFVSIGPGTVSEDGSLIVSNPGVGIVKAGWHCGGNPASSGTAHDCPTCQKCPPSGSHCVADNSLTCDDHDACTAGDHCDGGRCVTVPIRILSVAALADGKKQTTVPIEHPVTFTATATAEHCTPDIKWTFPDGSSMIGDTVTKAFQTPGFLTVKAEAQCGACPASKADQVQVTAVKLKDLKVISGASQDHVTDPDSWVALKSPSFFVTLQADVEPQVQDAADLITWSGGQEVPGNKFLRQVDRMTTRKETVSATLGPDTKNRDIWVTWATVELHSSGVMSTTDGIPDSNCGLGVPKAWSLDRRRQLLGWAHQGRSRRTRRGDWQGFSFRDRDHSRSCGLRVGVEAVLFTDGLCERQYRGSQDQHAR